MSKHSLRAALSALSLGLTLFAAPLAFAGGAIICSSGSTGACSGKQYCCYAGSESDGDKFCKSLGCKRGGTSSCPTAANVKSCGTRNVSVQPREQPSTQIAWCDPTAAMSHSG